MMMPFLIGLIVGGSLGFLCCALFTVNRIDREDKCKYIK